MFSGFDLLEINKSYIFPQGVRTQRGEQDEHRQPGGMLVAHHPQTQLRQLRVDEPGVQVPGGGHQDHHPAVSLFLLRRGPSMTPAAAVALGYLCFCDVYRATARMDGL